MPLRAKSQNPGWHSHRGFLFLEFLMRTYDKLIATIFARQATGDLRSFLGMHTGLFYDACRQADHPFHCKNSS